MAHRINDAIQAPEPEKEKQNKTDKKEQQLKSDEVRECII